MSKKDTVNRSVKELYHDEFTIGELLELFRNWMKILWSRKILIFVVTITTLVIGLTIEFTSGKEFEAQNAVISTSSSTSDNMLRSMGALGNLMNFRDLQGMGSSRIISENMLPDLLRTYPVGSRLAEQPLRFHGFEQEMSFYTFYLEHYQEPAVTRLRRSIFQFPRRMLSFLNPASVSLSNLRQDDSQDSDLDSQGESSDHSQYSQTDGSYRGSVVRPDLFVPRRGMMATIFELSERIEIERIDGILYVRATMPDPFAAADLARIATEFLMSEIVQFEIRKTADQLQFLEEEYELSRKRFEAAQVALAEFTDRNQGNLTQVAQIERQRLQNNLDLAFSLFSEWSRQIEQTRIRLREDTPLFIELDPVQVPSIPVRPNPIAATLISLFLGLFWSVGFVSVSALFRHFQSEHLEKNNSDIDNSSLVADQPVIT